MSFSQNAKRITIGLAITIFSIVVGYFLYNAVPDIGVQKIIEKYVKFKQETNNTTVAIADTANEVEKQLSDFIALLKLLGSVFVAFIIWFFSILVYFLLETYRKQSHVVELIKRPDEQKVLPCLYDKIREEFIKQYSPDMYLPLKDSVINLISFARPPIDSCNIGCNTVVFPFIEKEAISFKPRFGYYFNGKNFLTIHSKYEFPKNQEARTFIMAIYCTELPTDNPMFFFAYGRRQKHECNDGINNHNKSFGLFWGEPKPKDEIEEKYQGIGLRGFFYCEHCKEDRNEDCDTKVIVDTRQITINKWYVIAISYDGSFVKIYLDGICLYDQQHILETGESSYLNIGGFVHHDEDGSIVARDAKYSMHGYIREFMMFRKALSDENIVTITKEIKQIL